MKYSAYVSSTVHVQLIFILSLAEGSGEDYLRPITSYRLGPTDRMACVNLIILNDILFEDTETLTAQLTRVTDTQGGVISSNRLTLDPRTAEISILDNDRELLTILMKKTLLLA